ncbi:MAG: DNA polymerase IV [Candidatus Omnitrophica bacterium]|nr:DNA polymerase IV [Candidatus Omnitrophota bacterium]MDD5441466.1 DNA polymerase IV [Candidatus Omnitrophota bacterium]
MRYIAHIDMDAFFAAVEQRDNSKFLGKPVIIGADPKDGRGRGVVSTCSYEARRYGIRSAMPISQAYKLCPNGIFLSVNMSKYQDVSSALYEILKRFTPLVEPVSIDEAFLDLTGSMYRYASPMELCKEIKMKVRDELGLSASIGMAATKMSAKIASDMNKPDGLTIIEDEDTRKFLWPLNISKMWGVGQRVKEKLNLMGIFTIGDIAGYDVDKLIGIFGKLGLHYWLLANGKDDREVSAEEDIKSVSNEKTFDNDIADKRMIEAGLLALSDKISARLRLCGIKGRTIILKIRFSDFSTFTRSNTLNQATNYTEVIYKNILNLCKEFNNKKLLVRLIGIKVSNLTEDTEFPESLFIGDDEQKKKRLYAAIDGIKLKYGSKSVKRGY